MAHNSKSGTQSRTAQIGLTALTTAGLLAGAGSVAQAEVVVTNANLTTTTAPSTAATSGSDIFFNFATGQVQKTAFTGYQYRLNSTSGAASMEGVSANPNYNFLLTDCNSGNVLRLSQGTLISGGSADYNTTAFSSGGVYTISSATLTNDFWAPGDQGYVGILMNNNLPAGGSTSNYGWADIKINNDYTVTLNRFAYETIQGQGIAAGSTVSIVPEADPLELLLLGVAGLGAYRLLQKKRETAESAL